MINWLNIEQALLTWWSSENCMYKLQMKQIGGTSLILLHIPNSIVCPLMQWTYHLSLLPSHQASSPPICRDHLVKSKAVNLLRTKSLKK